MEGHGEESQTERTPQADADIGVHSKQITEPCADGEEQSTWREAAEADEVSRTRSES